MKLFLDLKVSKGVTRTVLLTSKYAFKLPGTNYPGGRWKRFLQGLLGNMQEVQFHRLSSKLCPVLFYIPGGWLVVMPRGQDLTEEEWEQLDFRSFVEEEEITLPVERKICSFKRFDDSILAVDFGQ